VIILPHLKSEISRSISVKCEMLNTEYRGIMKKFLILFIIVLSAIFQSGCSLQAANPSGQDMLDTIARPDMNAVEQYVDNWYLFHDDRIYAYLFDMNGNGEDTFFSTDLQGNDMRIISQSDKLRYAELYFIYDGYAYYYTTFDQGVKKINIETGEILDVVDDKYLYLIPETLSDGKVIAEYENNYLEEAHVYLATLDLEDGTVSSEKILPFFGITSYYYSRDNSKVYFLGTDSENNTCLYEDSTVIYTYPADTADTADTAGAVNVSEDNFVFTQDNSIFLITSEKIIRLDIDSHVVVAEKDLLNNGYRLYESIRTRSHEFKKAELTAPVCVLENPLFRSENNAVYQFDSQNMEFTEIVNIDKAYYSFIQKSSQHLILSGLDTTTVYDLNTGEASSYTSSNFGTDDENIYLMTYDGDLYQFEEACEFTVEKIKN